MLLLAAVHRGYDEDYCDWLDRSAELLRSGRWNEIDIAHMEITPMRDN